MSETIIRVEDLSKSYRLGEFGSGTITGDVSQMMARLRGKENPLLRIDEINDRATLSRSEFVWSLKDINFEVNKGDAVGIVGQNGAGKSTLLKILSRITSPTSGSVKIKGNIASLLEVGTGFHPDLTGRENIYLNGAILGMRKIEISRKFEEIVEFSGVQRYIDTPVKRYSSGMYVRLAFAVAANLNSEILIVDEVLAVGDAEFQKKCIAKMSDVSTGQGRTILFVSHNLESVRRLCNSCIILDKGKIFSKGEIHTNLAKYIGQQRKEFVAKPILDTNYYLSGIALAPDLITSLQDLEISFSLHSNSHRIVSSAAILIYNDNEQRVGIVDLRKYFGSVIRLKAGSIAKISILITALPFVEGEYTLGLYLKDDLIEKDFPDIIKFSVAQQQDDFGNYYMQYPVAVRGHVNLRFKASLHND